MSIFSLFKIYCLRIGAILMIIGVTTPIFSQKFLFALITYTLGLLLFLPSHLADTPKQTTFIIRRLRFQQFIGAFMFILTSILMFTHYFYIKPFVGQEWKISLMIATIFETYTIFRLSHEEKKLK